MHRYDVLTLHPQMVEGPLGTSMIGRARQGGVIDVQVHDMRDFGIGKHRVVDDTPYGGGAGMVMRVDVVAEAINAVKRSDSHVILTTPSGTPFQQEDAQRLSKRSHLIVVCGHYEGVDDRIHHCVDEQISLGDFVLTGGEIAAVAIVDAVARLVPGVLGNEASALDESFSEGLLEYPQYTRPREWGGHAVPEILLSGHHERVGQWRQEERIARTKLRRPDLYASWLSAKKHLNGGEGGENE